MLLLTTTLTSKGFVLVAALPAHVDMWMDGKHGLLAVASRPDWVDLRTRALRNSGLSRIGQSGMALGPFGRIERSNRWRALIGLRMDSLSETGRALQCTWRQMVGLNV